MAEERVENTRNIGILYADESDKGLTHPFFSLILNAFRSEAEAQDYDITFLCNSGSEVYGTYSEHCRSRNLAGIVLICVDFENPRIKELATGVLPCLTVDHIYKRVPAILSDNEIGVQKLVEQAIKMGHRRIAFVHGQNNSIVTRTRISQFGNTMNYHNLPVPPGFIRESRYHDITLTTNIVVEYLHMPDHERPTCILLPDDMTYLGAQEAAREMGLNIPGDISFGGYDGIPLMGYLYWGCVDMVSNGEGEMAKRYGQIYVDADNLGKGTFKRSCKDSYYWYQKCIASNGEDLD